MRHVSRTHRVALDWLFDRINVDSKIQIKYVDTKHQLADILTKGNFNSALARVAVLDTDLLPSSLELDNGRPAPFNFIPFRSSVCVLLAGRVCLTRVRTDDEG